MSPLMDCRRLYQCDVISDAQPTCHEYTYHCVIIMATAVELEREESVPGRTFKAYVLVA
jgi:hypothetical protein